jgi:hypothetical protein
MQQKVRHWEDARTHGIWFRGEVEQTLREADDPNVRRISNDDVWTDW